MSFLLYLIGSIVFISGLACLATLIGISHAYISAGALVLLAIGIFCAIARTRAESAA